MVDGPRKIRKTKALVHPDGTQELIAVGLVDSEGLTCYMLETDDVKHFKYADSNAIIRMLAEERDALEAELTRTQYRLKAADDELSTAYSACDKLLALASDMLGEGKFDKNRRANFRVRLMRIKNAIPTEGER